MLLQRSREFRERFRLRVIWREQVMQYHVRTCPNHSQKQRYLPFFWYGISSNEEFKSLLVHREGLRFWSKLVELAIYRHSRSRPRRQCSVVSRLGRI